MLYGDFLTNQGQIIHKFRHYFPIYENEIRMQGYEPVCFCDNDVKKHDTMLFGLPVMSLKKALTHWRDANFYVTLKNLTKKGEIFNYLSLHDIEENKIINFVKM